MYRIILVDDEFWTLRGIEQTFAWGKYGMEVASCFTSAQKALASIEKLRPAAIFTDIRMPGISGLDMLKNLRKRGFTTEVVIISGFSEFQYAQAAIREGAFDYVLKPINEESTDSLLVRLKARLDEKSRTQASRLLAELIDSEDSLKGKDASVIGLSSRQPLFQAAVYPAEAENFIRSKLKASEETSYVTLPGRRRSYLIANCARDIAPGLAPFTGPGAAGVSRTAKAFESVPSLMTQALIAQTTSFVTGQGGVYRYAPPQPEKLRSLVLRVDHLIDGCHMASLLELLRGLPAMWMEGGLSVEDLCWFWNEISTHMELSAHSPERTREKFPPLEWEQIETRFDDMGEFCQTLYENILHCQEKLESPGGKAGDDSGFSRLLSYIHQNYSRQIKLKDLASQFYLNRNYVSSLFQ